ncbi:MAG: SDR family NAD(P)-dependent oxidoreductase, partial [Prevotellaceae bacterium]|nr:SDR family NAD(P)-dependent oxidoreductase [Prevotellaceae bacterium]
SICSITFVSIVARNDYSLQYVLLWVGASFVFALISFLLLRTSSSVENHHSFHVVTTLALSILLKQVFLGLSVMSVHLHSGFSFPHLFALLIVDGLTCMAILTIEKLMVIVSYDVMRQRSQRRRKMPTVLVYGTSDEALAFERLQHISAQYFVKGFIKPGTHLRPYYMNDIHVYEFDSKEQFTELADRLDIDAVLFVNNNDIVYEGESLVRYCNHLKVKVLLNPPVEEVARSKGRGEGAIREVRIEDLLGRSEIKVDVDGIISEFHDKVVMVTGAAGSIGSQLCRQLCTYGVRQLVLLDAAESPLHDIRLELEESYPELDIVPIIGDVRSRKRLDHVFRQYSPQVVFHAAAYKHVPLMEENPSEAVLANVVGSRNVADKCVEYGVGKMIMVSTDKAVNPTNIMGCTKRLAEIYVQSLGLAIDRGEVKGTTKFVTTRFGNVLGSNGSVIPRFRKQIAKGGPVTVTHPEITRFFMTIPEACRLVLEAATMTSGNEIFVFDMGKSVRIADMARKMITLAGFVPDEDIKIEYTGLRPGEKLYEEVLATSENTIPTDHSSIRIARVRHYDYADVCSVLERMEDLAKKIEIDDMVVLMKQMVPEFKSNNSEFERFDNLPSVSIITPTYNCGPFIEETIRSVQAQTFQDWEMIIVDDGSKDDTEQIVMALAKKDERIRYIRNPKNCGAAVTRNRALSEARGEWIAFLDSDDLWLPQKLERQLAFMKDNDYAFTYHNYTVVNEQGEPLGIHISGKKKVSAFDMYSCCWPGCLTVMYNRQRIGLIQIADIKKDNDSAMWFQVVKKAPCYLLNEDLAVYRRREGSITPRSIKKKIAWHYALFRIATGMDPVSAGYWTVMNVFGQSMKKLFYIKKVK